jgi:hypothetical protein
VVLRSWGRAVQSAAGSARMWVSASVKAARQG